MAKEVLDLYVVIMQQLNLLDISELQRDSARDHIKASFNKINESAHEVVLEINSQKFLINIKAGLQKIEHFEVIAVKGMIEL